MATEGVLYYNTNTKCIVRLMVSIFALRKVYSGPCALIHDGPVKEDLRDFCQFHRVSIHEQPVATEYALVRKSQLWRVTPFQFSVFLDADTLPLASPQPLIDEAKRHGFVVHHFSNWQTTGGKISTRIRNWEPAIGKKEVKAALGYGAAINTGVFAFDRDAEILREWEQITRLGYERNCTRRLVDELAAQVLLHRYPHSLVGPEWGCSGRFGGDVKNPKIMHFHGSKHVMDDAGCDHWKAAYNELHDLFADRWPLMTRANGDKRFGRWYPIRKARPDITMVTAVNPDYIGKLEKNWAKWMKQPELSNQQWIVFANRLRVKDKRLAFLHSCPNVRVIKWGWPVAGDNVRERMLSAFVFGTAQHVTTPYWMKLDADSTPNKKWVWPDYGNHVITGHRCSYTATKGGNVPGHFLNHLDKHAGQQSFPPDISTRNYRHKRLASYCWIERTEFTRQLAAWCGDRLPVPSHDTTACYFAQHVLGYTIGEQMNRMNMREYFRP